MILKKIHFYLYTFCRYFLATIILVYAFAKILGTQFTSNPDVFDKPIGLLSGFELTWYYYGYSFWYGMIIAITQIVSSLLLFFRKTTRLGIILFLSFMINILLVDFAYNIDGAKGMAVLLTSMALFVFFSEYPLFIKYFFKEPPLYQDSARPNWINKFSKIKWIYIPIACVGIFFGLNFLKDKYMSKDQFYGTWKNADSTSLLHRFNFDLSHRYVINSYYDNNEIVWGKYSFKDDSIKFKHFTKDGQKFITFLEGKYQLTDKELIIQTDSAKIDLKRIR